MPKQVKNDIKTTNQNLNNEQILTPAGKKALQKELQLLIKKERPRVISEIKNARSQGDLAENAEFDAARARQGVIEDRIATIESILSHSQVIKVSRAKTVVHVGSTVQLFFNNEKEPVTYTIGGSAEANPVEGKISNLSPVAEAILGRRVGDEVVIERAQTKPKVRIGAIRNNH